MSKRTLSPIQRRPLETSGQRLKDARLEKGWGYKRVAKEIAARYGADAVGASPSTIQQVESGRHDSGFKTVAHIAVVLGLDPLEVLRLGLEPKTAIPPVSL